MSRARADGSRKRAGRSRREQKETEASRGGAGESKERAKIEHGV